MACGDCGEPDANTSLGGVQICDRCFDRRIEGNTGCPACRSRPRAFAVLGDHDADVETLVDKVRSLAETEIARRYLEPASHRAGWVVGEHDEVAGRLVWNDKGDNGKPYNVVVDGRTTELGGARTALEPYQGWGFRLVIEDRVHDARSDAEILELRRSGPGPADG